MNDKKNIDRLFQEKFKDFEAEPNKQVWLNIEAELKEKERKIIPFWVQFSGIAAAFILGLFTLNMVFNTNTENKKTIVLDSKNTTENKDSIATKKENKNIPFLIKNKQQIVITNPKTVRNHEKENTTFISSETSTEQKKNQNDTSLYKSKNNSSLKSVASNTNKIISDQFTVEGNPFINTNTPKNTGNEISGNIKSVKNSDTKVATTDAINSTEIIPETQNELEAILKKKEEKKSTVVLTNLDKWQIVPNVAAVYLNSNSSGSSIDPQFSENQKTADNSLSFGIGVNYAVSKKLTVRTGVNKLTLGYNTKDVIYSSSLIAHNLTNINYTSNESIEIKNESELNTLATLERSYQNTNTGAINQKMGYYEVPLELSYALINKKFGITVIGGISTLFLNQNKISLVSNTINLKLGEANNLNPIHFSTNVGMGFKYQFIKSFQINVEPMVKYQLNTYSNNSDNYKPVFIGLYSGISYTF
ncbi:hypothetical protein AB3G33_03930 [Flavobacterium sp. WC2421]|jgi:hypothetical protein|uniref:Outer membrane protein beta-barrel domain-containing protein n=2 Tax=unclassified Flavobacterium TaxID=196869 RepID=A0AB39WB87_9FLAO